MTQLIKDGGISYLPGSAFVPGSPGTPPIPAHYVQVVDYVVPAVPKQVLYFLVDTGAPSPRDRSGGNLFVLKQMVVPGTPAITYYKSVYVPANPGTPPAAAVPATLDQITGSLNIGWNSGARSFADTAGLGVSASSFVYKFSASVSSIGVVTGFALENPANVDPKAFPYDYATIGAGFYIFDSAASVIEYGVQKGDQLYFSFTDDFEVNYDGINFEYFQNGYSVYKSAPVGVDPKQSPIYCIKTAQYAAQDDVISASLTSASKQGADSAFLPLASFGSNKTVVSGDAAFVALSSTAGDLAHGFADSSISNFTSTGSNYLYGAGDSSLLPITSRAYSGLFAPDYAIGSGSISYLLSSGGMFSGDTLFTTESNTLLPISGFAADHNAASGEGSFSALTSYGAEAVILDGAVFVTLPKFTVKATATAQPLYGVIATVPMPTVQASGGSTILASMPRAAVQTSGTFVVVGRITAALPMPQLVASSTSGAVGKVIATVRDTFTVSAFAGAAVVGSIKGKFSLVAGGSAGNTVKIIARMPLFAVDARGTPDSFARITAAMPMLVPVPSAVLRALAPRFTVIAAGLMDVVASYEAYAMNLLLSPDAQQNDRANQVTHYTGFPFNQIVRHHDKYYGVSNTGLFLLGGDTDANAPIPWAVRTAKTDFGSTHKKTVVSAYVGGTVRPTATATVVAGENNEVVYSYPVPESATKQNYRVKFGRGLKTRYFALEMADAAGSQMQIDTLDLEIDQLKRSL